MTDQIAELMLQIDAPDLDANELDDLTRQLQNEIDQLDIEAVEQVKGGPAPEGAMGVDWAQIGELAIKLGPIVVPALVSVLKAWLDRQYKGSKKTGLKLNIRLKDFHFVLDQTMSRQEMANMEKELTSKIQEK